MPPSEQNPAPVSQPVSNVPEYLHLDPIPEPRPPKSKKKMVVLLMLVIVAVVAVGSVAAAWVYMSGEAERRLHGALKNAMATSYVSQRTVIKTDSTEGVTIDTAYDLSDPAKPKSQSTFAINAESLVVSGEVLVPDDTYYFVKFSEFPSGAISKGVVANQWYKVSRSNLAKAPSLIKSINFDRINQASFGNIITGKLDDGAVTTLMGYIELNNVYTIDNSTATEQQAVYELTLNSQRTGSLNKQFAELLNVRLPPMYEAMRKTKAIDSHHTLFIDAKTGRISQTVQVFKNDKTKKTATTTVTYTYPSSFSIEIPQNVKEVTDE